MDKNNFILNTAEKWKRNINYSIKTRSENGSSERNKIFY